MHRRKMSRMGYGIAAFGFREKLPMIGDRRPWYRHRVFSAIANSHACANGR